jgi:hypothetical protein
MSRAEFKIAILQLKWSIIGEANNDGSSLHKHLLFFPPPKLFTTTYGRTHNFSSSTSARSLNLRLAKRLHYSSSKGHLGICLGPNKQHNKLFFHFGALNSLFWGPGVNALHYLYPTIFSVFEYFSHCLFQGGTKGLTTGSKGHVGIWLA